MSDERWGLYSRKWLNRKHGRAYSMATVGKAKKFKAPKKKEEPINYWPGYVDVYWELGDCSQTVSLDMSFDVHNKDDYEKQLKKMDLLIQEAQDMRSQMVKQHKVAAKSVKKFKKYTRKNKQNGK